MTDNMIECVARAQFENAHEGHAGPGDVWEALRPEEREQWLRAARAAIEAMREPTVQMWGAGVFALERNEASQPMDAYRAMIDAALKGG